MYATEETVATDDSCFNNGQDDAVAGARIFYEDDPRNKAIRPPQTLEQADENIGLKLESDSKYVINTVTKHKKKWEDQGYIGVANKKTTPGDCRHPEVEETENRD
jgi:ribonuclease HI